MLGGMWGAWTLVPLDRLLFGSHDMDWKHVERWLGVPWRDWPRIEVEALADGWLFVHDGRHRATAAYELGHRMVWVTYVTN